MAGDLPGLNCSGVRGERVNSGDKEDEQREQGGAVGHGKDEEMD